LKISSSIGSNRRAMHRVYRLALDAALELSCASEISEISIDIFGMHPQNLGSVVILVLNMRVTVQKWATKSESSFSREKVLQKEATHGDKESCEESRKEKEEVVAPHWQQESSRDLRRNAGVFCCRGSGLPSGSTTRLSSSRASCFCCLGVRGIDVRVEQKLE